MQHRVYLSRRNLLSLLSKLDRKRAGDFSFCTLEKRDNTHPTYPQTLESLLITAVEDEDYYTDRPAGAVYPADEPPKAGATVHAIGCACGFCKLGSTKLA